VQPLNIGLFRFFSSLNAFLALMANASYFCMWLVYSNHVEFTRRSDLIFRMALALLALMLIGIWVRWALVPHAGTRKRQWAYLAGLVGLAVCNVILARGIVIAVEAASASNEELLWVGLYMMDSLWPAAGGLALASALLIFFGKKVA
jgi:hypothetical protein